MICEHSSLCATHSTSNPPPNPLRVSQLPKQVRSILISAIFTHAHCPRKYPIKWWARLFTASAKSKPTGRLRQAGPPLRKLSGNFQTCCELMQFGAAALNRTCVALWSGIFSQRSVALKMWRDFICTHYGCICLVWTLVEHLCNLWPLTILRCTYILNTTKKIVSSIAFLMIAFWQYSSKAE